MPALRNATTSNTASATKVGLTSLDNAGTDFSWGAWIRTDPDAMAGGQSSIWTHANDAASPRHGVAIFVLGNGELRIRPQTSSNNLVSSPNGLVTRRWNHFGIRKNATAVTFFLNGRAVAQVANTLSMTVSGTRTTYVGGPTYSGVQALHGADVWDIRVFPLLALSDAEMGMLADPTSIVRGCKQRLIYQHNWRVQGGGAVTLLDESGNGNSLTTSSTTEHAAVVTEPDWPRVLYGRRVLGYVAGGGPLVFSPSAASASATGSNPTLAFGGIVLAPSASVATAVTPDAVRTLGGITLTPPAAVATASTPNVTMTGGGITMMPSAASATAAGATPTRLFGGVIFSPSAAAATATTPTATRTFGGIVLMPSAAGATAVAVSVTVTGMGTISALVRAEIALRLVLAPITATAGPSGPVVVAYQPVPVVSATPDVPVSVESQ